MGLQATCAFNVLTPEIAEHQLLSGNDTTACGDSHSVRNVSVSSSVSIYVKILVEWQTRR